MRNSKLIKAIRKLDTETVKLVLASGKFAINGENSRHDPPLIESIASTHLGDDDEAADSKRCEILKLLVRYGADLNVLNVRSWPLGATAVVLAAERGYLKCVQFLTEAGADLRIVCGRGNTALLVAARESRTACVEYLTRHMSPSLVNHVNARGDTALLVAASNSHGKKAGIACLQHIINAGADLEVRDNAGNTALTIALKQKYSAVATLLVEKGALVNTVLDDGKTPLTVADISYVPKLLRHVVDPTTSRRDQWCVHRAVLERQNNAVRALVRYGFPALDLDGKLFPQLNLSFASPLVVALVSGEPDIAKYFITNRFFTLNDIKMCWKQEIRESLLFASNGEARIGFEINTASHNLKNLDFLARKLFSLQDLCLVTISSTLSEPFAHEPTQGEHDRWVCRPTFLERVQRLGIPQVLKDALLHKTPASDVCCGRWGDIDLEPTENFSGCYGCGKCAGEDQSEQEDKN
ncbi:ankyrin repeat family protein [Elysia marginata]|uniref:Ankyrin repeat family protein n=1 Tax=Elysia marginata TaxID=1093978 RepID=A0AAV4JNW2_9GAST|nr:ankyrin repeat family protein [Elysia marginata]